jgi:integrase/recombinase XerD
MSSLAEGFLDALAAERGAAQNTLDSYRRDLAVYFDFLSDRGRGPLEAGDDDIRALQAQGSRQGLSPATVARRLSAIRQFHKHLFVEGLRADDPSVSLEGPRRRRPLPKTLTVAEVDRLISRRARASTIPSARRASG